MWNVCGDYVPVESFVTVKSVSLSRVPLRSISLMYRTHYMPPGRAYQEFSLLDISPPVTARLFMCEWWNWPSAAANSTTHTNLLRTAGGSEKSRKEKSLRYDKYLTIKNVLNNPFDKLKNAKFCLLKCFIC